MKQLIKRIFKYAWQSFRRNGWLSAATITVIVLSIFIFSGALILNQTSNIVIKSIKDKVDISIYFKNDMPEEDIFKIKDEIGTVEGVARVDYISQQKALEIFKEQRKSDPLISRALEELGENPLSASLNIKARKSEDYPKIVNYLENAPFKDRLITIDLAQNQKIINRLNALTRGLKSGSLILDFILTFVAIIVAFNTIRMAIYSLREEITIMRLTGASNWFIRGPFLVNGIFYGVLAAVITMIIYIPLVLWFSPKISAFVSGFNLNNYFFGHFFELLGLQLFFGIVIGLVSSFIAIAKYLKV